MLLLCISLVCCMRSQLTTLDVPARQCAVPPCRVVTLQGHAVHRSIIASTWHCKNPVLHDTAHVSFNEQPLRRHFQYGKLHATCASTAHGQTWEARAALCSNHDGHVCEGMRTSMHNSGQNSPNQVCSTHQLQPGVRCVHTHAHATTAAASVLVAHGEPTLLI
jgi:hypothetical protein